MRTLTTTTVAVLFVILAGCSPQPSAGPLPTDSPTASSTATVPVVPVVEVFAMPAACRDILPVGRLAEFDTDGIALLGGPDGEYGDEYLLDPSPEQRAGGITCIWGPPDTEVSSVTISVAPLSASARAAIVTDLSVNQGLNESQGETATYYWQLGDLDHQPAILNALANDSWISVIVTVGGIDSYADAERLAAEVHELVYN